MPELKMPDVNSVMIAGNLTSDPTLRKTTNGTPVANFFIAANRKFKDNTGQWRENVCFVGVVAWYKLAESCYQFLKKGSAVLIEGELQSRSWKNSEGMSNNVVEIKARRIQFLNRQPRHVETAAEMSFEDAMDELSQIDLRSTSRGDGVEMVDSDAETEDTGLDFDYKIQFNSSKE
ncbi:MAG: single-stranded DNA-binding protein [Calditrichaeota bacterium]|nr:MAG: single-stranded DNA-binding protein [Calditrichota bacterium]